MNIRQKLKNVFNQKTVVPESAIGEFRNYCQAALQTAYVAKLNER
jgi:hypothetical protein